VSFSRKTRRITLLSALAALVAASLARPFLRSRSNAGDGSPVRFKARRSRNLQIALLGAQTGSSYVAHRARRAFVDAGRRRELDTAFELKTAEQIADSLGNMKGALMKIGQMLSYLDQGLPEHVRTVLAELQHNAPPMSAELAAAVIVEELGAAPDVVFAEWDPVPIASASIGQVHRAITLDGRAVAVKVQYPGVAEAIASDLDNASLIFAGLGFLFPGLEQDAIVTELRERLVEELDYVNEARNQELFRSAYLDHPTIHVPQVFPEYSTTRVLTTELADGVHWSEMLTWGQEEKNLSAETLYRFAFGSLFRLAAFNGDPHPGNYLFRPGGQITFLDFGLVKQFTPTEVVDFGDMIKSIVLDPDPAEFRSIVEKIGLLPVGLDVADADVFDYLKHFYDFVHEDGIYTITPEFGSESIRRIFDTSGPFSKIQKAANVPPSFVVIQRINLGLYSMFGELHATGNWRRLAEEIWPFVNGPPSTPMGHEIERWSERRQPALRGAKLPG
jgi:predicted unusual protein kinase regulating ubiquinone biosynthesis (AarF/ABC1/UbiB family)